MGFIIWLISVGVWVWLLVRHLRCAGGKLGTFVWSVLGAVWSIIWVVVLGSIVDEMRGFSELLSFDWLRAISTAALIGGFWFGHKLADWRTNRAVRAYDRHVQAQAQFEHDVRSRLDEN